MAAESRLVELGITLPPAPPAAGLYVDAVRTGNLLFVSGKGPRLADGSRAAGKVGAGVSIEEARRHARLAGLVALAAVRRELGSLDGIVRVVKVLGMVNAVPDFESHPQVIDGCSELFLDIFGKNGAHARSAIGVGSLPGNMTVEIEVIFEIAD